MPRPVSKTARTERMWPASRSVVISRNPNQPGQMLRGVAPAAGLIAVQVFHLGVTPEACGGRSSLCLTSFDGDQVRALEWLYANRTNFNLAAINMSLAGDQHRYACDTAPQANIIGLLRSAGVATIHRQRQ